LIKAMTFGPVPLVLLLCSFAATAPLLAASAADQYSAALSHERGLRAPADTPATLTQLRRGIERYEAIVRQYPRSGYSDNALWQAAGLALEAYDRYGDASDQQVGERLLRTLVNEYPSSSLVPRVGARLVALAPVDVPVDAPQDAAATGLKTPIDVPVASAEGGTPAERTGPVRLRSVRRETLTNVVRVTLELDDEVPYFSGHLDAPARLYFDLAETDALPALWNVTLPFDDGDIVREIRTGRQRGEATRVVVDVEGVESYSVYALYNPYRLIVDSVRLPELRGPGVADAPAQAEVADEPPTDRGGGDTLESAPTAPVVAASDVEAQWPAPVGLADQLVEPAGVVVDAMPPTHELSRTEAPTADAATVPNLELLPVPESWSSLPLAALVASESAVREAEAPMDDAEPEPATEAVPAEDDRAWPRDHDLLYPNLGTPPVTLAADAAQMTEPMVDALPLQVAKVPVAEVTPTSSAPVVLADAHESTFVEAPVELPFDLGLDADVDGDHVEPVEMPAAPGFALTEAPALTADGAYSLGRQLGLGVSRVVIDPGHGGYDPGARSGDLAEAALVLDVAERLESKLVAEGIEVVLTRRSDVYVSLRARTELANRVGADVFLSIHANAAEDPEARGIETYHLDFATDPTAKAVAARENAGTGDSMHDLPELVRSITMGNKVDESRELALRVQRDLVAGVRQSRPDAQDLGVKQAPFMVLIGATMPSVLTEISFLTNEDAAAHLATSVYRDQIAEALCMSVVGYQRALKPATRVAANDD
jgi:N-acetylmuramoyl-L-alanine amidase